MCQRAQSTLQNLPIAVLVVAVVALAPGASLWATAVDWSQPSGSNPRFGWSLGRSGDGDLGGGGLWGDPVVTEQGFQFNDMNPLFFAEATFPSSDNILSNMSVTINRFGAEGLPGAPLTELHIREWGTYTGDIEDVAASSGTLLLVPIGQGPPKNFGQLDMTFNPADHTWVASMDVMFADFPDFPDEVNILSIDATNHLKAIPLDGVASIQKLGASVAIPEPSTLLIALCGLFFLPRRA